MIRESNVTVLGIGGSISENSCSNVVLRLALKAARDSGANTTEILLRNMPLPFFTERNRQDSVAASMFVKTVAEADGIIIASPEYHSCFSGVLKNALDFITKDEIRGKPIGLISICGGNHGGISTLDALGNVIRSLHGLVLPHQVVITRSHKNISPEGQSADESVVGRLKVLGQQVAAYSARLMIKSA
jgi:FMN reductase